MALSSRSINLLPQMFHTERLLATNTACLHPFHGLSSLPVSCCASFAAIRGGGGSRTHIVSRAAVLMLFKEISLSPPPKANQLKKHRHGSVPGLRIRIRSSKGAVFIELQDPDPYSKNGSRSVFRKRTRYGPRC
jgi:hypothetical protein